MSGGFISMQAATDRLGPGAIHLPIFETEVLDMVKERGVLGQRITAKRASGQPARYFEQTRGNRGRFANPHALSYQPGNDPTRRERAFRIKAIYNDIGFNLFDKEVTEGQGVMGDMVSSDLESTIQGVLTTSDIALWRGSDTNLTSPTSDEYVGGLTQINRTATIASSASIVDGLKAEVAALIDQEYYMVTPTAIYINSVLGDLIDREEKANQRHMSTVTVTGGLKVQALSTQAGVIPLIPDSYLFSGPTGGSAHEAGKTDYPAVILTESLVERHWVGSPIPRVFPLGEDGSLDGRFAVVQFDGCVFKGKGNPLQDQSESETNLVTYAHSYVTVVR